MKIQVLGSGCKKCKVLELRVNEALENLAMEAQVIKVEDPLEIMGFGVMSTPALVIDGEVKFSGSLPDQEEIEKLIKAYKE
ncbi:MAG: thioredoxin family protein [Spirochaetaceae bacterium]|jgi:small redox-active disulfide protein 2|nr:thioredoxin family protein [Spirochaetaceae bacterium]